MEKGIPFDAPLWEGNRDNRGEWWNCESISAFFTISGSVTHLLPDGLVPADEPALGAVMVGQYRSSTVGPYLEAMSMIQVRSGRGEVGLYVPYIYVTTDVALASGREAFGFPKKLATIHFTRWSDMVLGTLERPPGKRLITLVMKPNSRLDPALREMVSQSPTFFYTVRHLPGPDGLGHLTQLVKSVGQIQTHLDAKGREILFTGTTSLTYDSPSAIDPVHNLAIGQVVAGVYREFDMTLEPGEFLAESFTPALVASAVG